MLTYPRGSTSNLSPWMVLPRHSTVHIASAMVKLVGFHLFITFRGVRTGFLWFLTCFSSFLHDFCVQYLRRTNFSRATRFLVDLPAHGGAVGFFISGFVATALQRVRYHAISSRFRTEIFENFSLLQNFACDIA